SHDACNDEVADFEVHAHFLTTFDDEIAVRQNLGHHGRNRSFEAFLTVHRTIAVVLDARVEVDGSGWVNAGPGDVGDSCAEDAAHAGRVRRAAAALGLVVDLGAIVNGDHHREDVADAV